MSEPMRIQTPGRVCLYGDHQDYLGLPVIACAIDRYIDLRAEAIDSNEFRIELPDLGRKRCISLDEEFTHLQAGDHFGSGLRVIRSLGLKTEQGYTLNIQGDLPVNAGVSSSSAVMVAWMHFLTDALGAENINPERLGQLAYRAEVLEHNSPGGNMDQLTIACGGLVHIDTRGEGQVSSLPLPRIGMVLGVSGIPKKTLGTLGSAREMAGLAISTIQKHDPNFELRTCTPERLSILRSILPEELRGTFEAAVINHHITQQATAELRKASPSSERLGKLMSAHHAQLRDNLHLSTPLIEDMITAAIDGGALGGKIVGSGGGGCVVAICHPGRQQEIAGAMKETGAVDAFPINISKGSHRL